MLTMEQAAALGQNAVRMATLVEMQFASQTMRLWNGVGRIDIAGLEWRGTGVSGQIDGLPQTRRIVSEKVTFTLSGIDAQVQAVAALGQDDVQQRPILAWLQLFDDDWQPLGARLPAWWGLMQRIRQTKAPRNNEGDLRTVSIEAENIYMGRARPPARRYTDRDQQALYPGDQFFRFVADQRVKTVVWPTFS